MEPTVQTIGGVIGIVLLLIIYGYVARILKIIKEVLHELKKK